MKRGRPVIVAEQAHMRAMDTLRQTADTLGCSLVRAQEQVCVYLSGFVLLCVLKVLCTNGCMVNPGYVSLFCIAELCKHKDALCSRNVVCTKFLPSFLCPSGSAGAI